MTSEQEKEYLLRIRDLEKQVSRLQTELKKNSETDYGLRWMNVPEAFEEASENAIPTLEEVKEKAISNEDGKPTHILIEGDNYHALTCLNYTHKGKIDVIYIDPPYNTGSDGFMYRDKRFLKEFPDGSPVPKDHPLRHSYWLSFMEKRLRLAENLLSKGGVIFISIDDNEQANLKLLCDQIFGEKNFVTDVIWRSADSSNNDSKQFSIDYNHTLVYSQNPIWQPLKIARTEDNNAHYKNPDNDPNGPWFASNVSSPNPRANLMFDIISPQGYVIHPPKNGWRWSKEKMQEFIDEGAIIFPDNGKRLLKKTYLKDQEGIVPSNIWWDVEITGHNRNAKYELIKLFPELKTSEIFGTPKPTKLIKRILELTTKNSSVILDFFAGSGTTMHATMQLNQEDNGHRQCILVQQNENNICEGVTYERNRRVMQGYKNAKGEQVVGIGNSMKYYRTAFVGEHVPSEASDQDKTILAQKAGCLLALSENTLEEIRATQAYQIFALRDGDKPTNNCLYTAVYFSGSYANFGELRQEIEKLQTEHNHPKIAIYVFCWGDPSVFEYEFDDLQGLVIKDIPQPILDIYNKINA